MADREKVQTILNKTNPKLRTDLDVNDDFLIHLQATDPEVITDSERAELRKLTRTARVDHLLDLLRRRSRDQFYQFMEVLQKKDGELYLVVKGVYDKQFPGHAGTGI